MKRSRGDRYRRRVARAWRRAHRPAWSALGIWFVDALGKGSPDWVNVIDGGALPFIDPATSEKE